MNEAGPSAMVVEMVVESDSVGPSPMVTKSKVKSVIDTPVTGGNTMPRTNIVQRRVHTKLYEVANNKQ